MRAENLITLLTATFLSCSHANDAASSAKTRSSEPISIEHVRPVAAIKAFDFDVIQRTCAMYVAMHSAAFRAPIAFDRTIDDGLVHWNKCPSGNMVACATVSPVTDPAQPGIPWPY